MFVCRDAVATDPAFSEPRIHRSSDRGLGQLPSGSVRGRYPRSGGSSTVGANLGERFRASNRVHDTGVALPGIVEPERAVINVTQLHHGVVDVVVRQLDGTTPAPVTWDRVWESATSS